MTSIHIFLMDFYFILFFLLEVPKTQTGCLCVLKGKRDSPPSVWSAARSVMLLDISAVRCGRILTPL